MSFDILAARIVCWSRHWVEGDSPTVIDLGNQSYTIREYDALAEIAAKHTVRIENPSGIKSTADFYAALGFSRYVALDVNEQYGASIADLNYPIRDQGIDEQFDFVMNYGTGEHVFNYCQFLENAHVVTKPGGVMVHMQPFAGWINHGFYLPQPCLYEDLAYANGYAILGAGLSDRRGELAVLDPRFFAMRARPEKKGTENPFVQALRDIGWEARADLNFTVVFRKLDDSEFRLPFQSKYRRTIEPAALQERYGRRE